MPLPSGASGSSKRAVSSFEMTATTDPSSTPESSVMVAVMSMMPPTICPGRGRASR